MALIFHDRWVTGASGIIPGLGSTTCVRDFSDDANIQVVDDTTTVTDGPGGTLDNSSLDGGTSSSHGYCSQGTLPGGGVNILSRTASSESVTFSYPYGSGAVIYSTMPLDFYLGSGTSQPQVNYRDVYAPNVVQYASELFCGGQIGAVGIPALGLPGALLLVAALSVVGVLVLWRMRVG